MSMKGRTWQSEKYRYGFNGKENDGDGGFQDYGMRVSKEKIGRFMSVDPITAQYPELTPYQFASNTPIQAIDLDGLEAVYPDYKSKPEVSKIQVSQFKSIEKQIIDYRTVSMPSNNFRISHLYMNENIKQSSEISVSWTGVNTSKGTTIWGINNSLFAFKARSISLAIPGEEGKNNAVLNSFSDFVNNHLGKTDKNSRKNLMTDGYGKVFRHILWQAILTKEVGYNVAKSLGDAQEYKNLLGEDKNKEYSHETALRDLVNNEYGRQIGLSFKEDLSNQKSLFKLLNDISERVISSFPELNNKIHPSERRPFTERTKGVKELHEAIK